MPGGRDGVLADNSLPAPATVGANLRNLNSDILGEIIAAVVALSCIVRALIISPCFHLEIMQGTFER